VSLEPCAHQGRTPPCANQLVEAKVARVVAAIEDPNPLVHGRGAECLRDAGIKVDIGLMAAEAEEAHRGFLYRMRHGRPWMRIKSAASLDGRIALANGESRWITGEAARPRRACVARAIVRDPHRHRHGAAGRSRLTVRHVPAKRQPRRVLIDSRLQVSPPGADPPGRAADHLHREQGCGETQPPDCRPAPRW
jgi:diaminohydroxyphosphoribosylaminopyrimidine deaminase/5-amino-6-(5-phosphoribosylamino)uracil reductase